MKQKNYYIYVKGILNLYALIHTTTNLNEAKKIKSLYKNSKIIKNKKL